VRLVSVLLAGSLLAACNATPADPVSAEKELRAANEEYDRGLIDGDAAVLDRFYASDFTIIDDDAGIHDKKNQIAFMTKEVDLLDARSSDVNVRMLGADAAMITGRFAGRYRYQGKESDFTERYTSVWVRRDGRWQVQHEHASLLPKPRGAETQ
jgi:ketosteroid isomerase-like protein